MSTENFGYFTFPFFKVIEADLLSSNQWALTEEGKLVAEGGSHEAQVFNAVPVTGSITQAEIMVNKHNTRQRITRTKEQFQKNILF